MGWAIWNLLPSRRPRRYRVQRTDEDMDKLAGQGGYIMRVTLAFRLMYSSLR